MKLRSALMMALMDHIARTGLSQSEAAQLLGVTQPRISDLMRGKIELFWPRYVGQYDWGGRHAS
jgi:predicted XRE-type DNA-binding protein